MQLLAHEYCDAASAAYSTNADFLISLDIAVTQCVTGTNVQSLSVYQDLETSTSNLTKLLLRGIYTVCRQKDSGYLGILRAPTNAQPFDQLQLEALQCYVENNWQCSIHDRDD